MKAEVLQNKVFYVEDKLAELEALIDSADPTEKEYGELIDTYNKWASTYMRITEELASLEDFEAKEAKEEREKRIDLILRCAELGCKVFVPTLCIMASVGIAKLSYVQDQKLALRNGNVMGNSKDLMQMARMKMV